MPVARAIKAAVALSLTAVVAVPVAAYTAHVEPRAVTAPPPLVAGVHMNAITTAMRDTAPPIRHRILGTDNGPMDALAGQYLSDVLDFWDETPLPQGKGFMLPPNQVASFDSRTGKGATICLPEDSINAGACRKLNGMTSIEWDRGVLIPSITRGGNDLGAGVVLSHEIGHLADFQLREDPLQRPKSYFHTLINEQKADCLSGAWMAYVADGRSRRFTVSPDGLGEAMLSAMVFRDPIMKAGHGIGIERLNATLQGFTYGVDSCADIDGTWVSYNRQGMTKDGNAENPLRWKPLTEDYITELRDAVGAITGTKPELTTEPCDTSDDPAAPAEWCRSRTEVSANMGVLGAEVERTRSSDKDLPARIPAGPGTLLSPLLAAMVQPYIRASGAESTSTNTACVVGYLSRALSTDTFGDLMDFGDLDEIAAEMLGEGRGATAADGSKDRYAVNRVTAYLYGVYRAGNVSDCV